jgi:luciferase-like monooxygenase
VLPALVMEAGVHLPLIDFGGEGFSYHRLAETVDAARECGFAAVSANDHFLLSVPWLDGLTALAAVAGRSGGMDLVTTLALASLRGPVPLAKAFLALDALSGARVIAGVGPGSSKADYEAVGVPFEQRWQRFDEAARLLKALLEPGAADGSGTGHPALQAGLSPAPRQRPGVPVWIGSWGSHAGLRRVACLGDGWLASAYNTSPQAFAAAVYSYYGELFLAHPYLLWAGMASMIGPAFYAGFRDLGVVPDAVRTAVLAVFGRASRRLARRAAGDLGFYETTFLIMQKKIFEDQATMHEAYLAGGLPQVEEFYRARIIDLATFAAWRQIDTGRRGGDQAAVADGNRTLLFREQHDIIDRFYVQMLGHAGLEGPAFTYLLTLAGTPSVPSAHSYPERYPLTIAARLRRGQISARTPLADGNIAVFANRWQLIDDDTLPHYLALIRDDPERARALVATPIRVRMARYRLLARVPALTAAALTRWHLDITAAPGLLIRAAAAPVRAAATKGTTIDLTRPPTRESAGFAAGASSRIWMNPGHQPVEVAVNLPSGHVYHAVAAMAAMLSPATTRDPDHLTVQLPAADLDATGQLLAQYAPAWGFPPEEVTTWRASAAPSASASPGDDTGPFSYSTRVFTGTDAGFVHVEFQVSHHLPEHDFVVTALFTWDTPLP